MTHHIRPFLIRVLLLACAAGLPAQQAADAQAPKPLLAFAGLLHLEFDVDADSVRANVHAGEAGFVGLVLLSASTAQVPVAGLPPIFVDFVVLGIGHTETQDLLLRMPIPGVDAVTGLYGQALAVGPSGVWVGGIVPLVAGD